MLISNYTSMNYYMPKLIGTSITLLCGVFDASASMGKILGIIYDNGATLESIFIAMAILSLTTIVKSCILHPYKPIPKVVSYMLQLKSIDFRFCHLNLLYLTTRS